jgi:hypothetical protein
VGRFAALNLGILLTIVFGATSVFFSTAEQMRGGTVAWANDACRAAPLLCEHPDWPALAAAVMICAVVIAKLAVGSGG